MHFGKRGSQFDSLCGANGEVCDQTSMVTCLACLRQGLDDTNEEWSAEKAQLAERARELGEARKESQSFWAKVQRQKENLTNLNDRVNDQGAENAKLKTELAERTRELEAERSTSHGLRLLLGTCDQVQAGLIKERDEARAEVAGSERERLLAIGDSARLSMDLALTNVKLDEARAESARLRERIDGFERELSEHFNAGYRKGVEDTEWHDKESERGE